MSSPTRRTVRLAVLTYRRPADISAAVPRLVEQAATVSPEAWETDVLVIDNSPDGDARELVERLASENPQVPVRYAHQPTPGIAAARNLALEESADIDLLVYFDDDERPANGWLEALLGTYVIERCAAVVGPVISEFSHDPEPWILEGGFFNRRRLPTGTLVTVAATNNLLLDLHVIRRIGLTFDLSFGLSGGSDTLFTRALHLAGGRMVWCDEAVVYDAVPSERITRKWVTRRALRSGTSWSATSLRLAANPLQRLQWQLGDVGVGLTRVIAGIFRLATGVMLRKEGLRAQGVRNLARGAGLTSGAFGYRYMEYKRR